MASDDSSIRRARHLVTLSPCHLVSWSRMLLTPGSCILNSAMDLPKLRIFATVARLGNFTRAAELLHLTQPTVSQQIAMLETHIGAPLIERLPRRLRLTPAGEAL